VSLSPFRRRKRRSGDIESSPATVHVLPSEDADESVPRTGAVQSVQEAEVRLPAAERELLWKPETLERLARAYWAYVTRLFLNLVRVDYAADSTSVVFLTKRLPLLRFGAPEYETEEDGSGGSVTWPIERGVLVARQGRDQGQLLIRVHRIPEDDIDCDVVQVRVAVRNFYPWLRGQGRFARFGTWIYARTQLAMHVIVCNGFLRSLASLELPEPPEATDSKPAPERDPSRVGAGR